jgi:hypothetical protein
MVRAWAVPSLEQQWECEMPLQDGRPACALHCRHPALALDALWVYHPGNEPILQILRGQAMENRVTDLLRPGGELMRRSHGSQRQQACVLEALAVHPTQPHVLTMMTSIGLAIYAVGATWTPTVALRTPEVSLPMPAASAEHAQRRSSPPSTLGAPPQAQAGGRQRSSGTESLGTHNSATGQLTADAWQQQQHIMSTTGPVSGVGFPAPGNSACTDSGLSTSGGSDEPAMRSNSLAGFRTGSSSVLSGGGGRLHAGVAPVSWTAQQVGEVRNPTSICRNCTPCRHRLTQAALLHSHQSGWKLLA